MTRMLDRWHDYYHTDTPDYINCPYCQEELLAMDSETLPLPVVEIDAEVEWGAWLEATYDPDNGNVDRLEDLEI